MILCFFFNDTATTEIYTLSLHDALPIWLARDVIDIYQSLDGASRDAFFDGLVTSFSPDSAAVQVAAEAYHREPRSEEHTSELQSRQYLVCRLLLEKKNHSLYCYMTRLLL